ncbi:alpha-ketoacid dehydrogenase subunit beta [Desulforhopalus singaporensis]|uniref:Pyruvate dehydrogenase E1 component beta subunit n=1 Tax=Desulforhopalus singaporensis TaxID=91360 RepID=A0A1H0VUG3_9BACT|nr:alpha-ketoacid dehydrogenase subunit beta [Desulforhopalus singaporensis]SDP82187.1 pyruvate dehydrogenase E1 component beta subunit [Desulforhopalus singaporensis]
MREISYADAVVEAIEEEMDKHEEVFVLGEDIGRYGGAYFANPKLWKKFGDERVRDTPISESAIVGFALGAAITGMRPVAEIMFSDIMTVAMDQIVNQVAKMRYMFGGNVKVPLVIRTPIGGFHNSAAQHSQSLESWFAHVPGLKVAMPSSPYAAKGLLKTAIQSNNPVIFFEHIQLYRLKGPVPEEEYYIPFGEANILREGTDLTVVASAVMVHRVMNVANKLEEQGIQIEVIDPQTLCPFDKETILSSIKKTGRLFVVHQACKTCGFGAEIAAIVAEEGFDYLIDPIQRLAAYDIPVPFASNMEDFAIPNEQRILSAITEFLGK